MELDQLPEQMLVVGDGYGLEHLQTTAPAVWAAIGGGAGSQQFTHVSVDDFRAVHDSHAWREARHHWQIPFCLFTDPEFARLALSEKEAKANGTLYRLFKIPMEGVLRARTLLEMRGFLCEACSRRCSASRPQHDAKNETQPRLARRHLCSVTPV